jgi:hypothetical protein
MNVCTGWAERINEQPRMDCCGNDFSIISSILGNVGNCTTPSLSSIIDMTHLGLRANSTRVVTMTAPIPNWYCKWIEGVFHHNNV